jgi:asparagine synthase (glutamine-hydrolysing)
MAPRSGSQHEPPPHGLAEGLSLGLGAARRSSGLTMCGVAGALRLDGGRVDRAALARMTLALAHRGPDGWGSFFHGPRGVSTDFGDEPEARFPAPSSAGPARLDFGMGHRRLSILDLSAAGRQPMSDHTGRYWISYNGEIYNFRELRAELGGGFRSGSDTEVLLEAYARWGRRCLEKLNGIWAFAIWDAEEQTLFLARDRFGVKPLYYSLRGGVLVFASEPKAILTYWQAAGMERPAADEEVVAAYLAIGVADFSERTFFRDVFQLPAASFAEVRGGRLIVGRYYDLPVPAGANGHGDPRPDELAALLDRSIRLELRSDVPVGHCLSGGIDSSGIACLTRRTLDESGARNPQATFSAVYDDSPAIDERRHIETVVRHIGADAHFAHPAGAALFEGDLERLVYHQDEPFLSLSMYAQLTVFRAVASAGVKVVLDGQGADELFAGYHYFESPFLADLLVSGQLGRLGRELRAYQRLHGHSAARLLARTAADAVGALVPGPAGEVLRDALTRVRRAETGRSLLRTPEGGLPGEWAASERFRRGRGALGGALVQSLIRTSIPQLLRFEDRNSMACSVEARVPFLDHEIVEWAVTRSSAGFIRDGITKAPLRAALGGVVPRSILERTDKLGYPTPDAQWMGVDGADYLRDVFASASFARRSWFDTSALRKDVDILTRAKDARLLLQVFRALNLELWARRFLDRPLSHDGAASGPKPLEAP